MRRPALPSETYSDALGGHWCSSAITGIDLADMPEACAVNGLQSLLEIARLGLHASCSCMPLQPHHEVNMHACRPYRSMSGTSHLCAHVAVMAAGC